MIASHNCYTLLKHYEGCKLSAYLDSGNIPTIGYGNTFYTDGKPVKMGQTITQEAAEMLLPAVLHKFEISVNKALRKDVLQHQYDALVCLTYNIGIGNFISSSLLASINAGTPDSANFLKWNKAKVHGVLTVLAGLTYRRMSEKYLFDTGEVKFFN